MVISVVVLWGIESFRVIGKIRCPVHPICVAQVDGWERSASSRCVWIKPRPEINNWSMADYNDIVAT